MATWQPYSPGQEVGNLTIIKLLGRRTTSRSQRYLVRSACCGEETELGHHAIQRRVKKGTVLCGVCAKRRNGQLYGNPRKER